MGTEGRERRAAQVVFSWEIAGVLGRGRGDAPRHPAPAAAPWPRSGPSAVGQSWVLRLLCVGLSAILFFPGVLGADCLLGQRL